MMDNLTPDQRSYCMSQIKSKDTALEIRIRSFLHKKGMRFRKHSKELPGKPDIVFHRAKVVVFIDGDFWHGHRFKTWENKLSDFWKRKISKNRERDLKNNRVLKKMGWTVIRLWQHNIEHDFERSIARIIDTVKMAVQTEKRHINHS